MGLSTVEWMCLVWVCLLWNRSVVILCGSVDSGFWSGFLSYHLFCVYRLLSASFVILCGSVDIGAGQL